MSYGILNNCIITNSNATILNKYDREKSPWVDLEGSNIYSPCYGVIIQISKFNDNRHYSVVLQYNGVISLRFTNLTKVYVSMGELVELGNYIGLCDRYVRVELLIPQIDKLPYPTFRVVINKDLSLFKEDPTPLLDGTIKFEIPSEVV